MSIYYTLIYNPLLNILIFFYNLIGDLGGAIIILTIFIRLILYPLSNKMIYTQTVMQKIQPEIKFIQQKYKKDPSKQLQEMLNLYKKNKVNPFSVYLFLFIQMPFLIALFQIFTQGIQNVDNLANNLYSFIHRPESINLMFLDLINLSKPSIIIAVVSTLISYIQIKMSMSFSKSKNKLNINSISLYIIPITTFLFLLYLPSAVGLYWFTISIVSLINQYFINKKIQKNELAGIYQ